MKRTTFVASSAVTAAMFSLFPDRIFAAPERMYTRLEITEFAKDARLVKAFRDGVKAMRDRMAECNGPDWAKCTESSWQYWHNSHMMASGSPPEPFRTLWNQCPHGRAYFYAWHRGFVYFFEKKVRELSGNADFALPYWDYYKNPVMPNIFTDARLPDGSENPLYWANRVNTRVSGLSLSAFGSVYKNFPRGFQNAFEPAAESNPHNVVHGAIGGSMGGVGTAALDPVFWVHHCNIDRLWSAWLRAGDGRSMPPSNDPWWNKAWIWDRAGHWRLDAHQMADSRNLGYTFADLTLPTKVATALPTEPPVLLRGAKSVSGPLTLGGRNFTLALPIAENDQPRLRALAKSAAAARVNLVLEDVQLTELGKKGGFVINVYVNLPKKAIAQTAESDERYLIGSVDSFSISTKQMMEHGPISLTFSAARALADQAHAGALNAKDVLVSFVGFGSAEHATAGEEFVKVGRVRLETASQ